MISKKLQKNRLYTVESEDDTVNPVVEHGCIHDEQVDAGQRLGIIMKDGRQNGIVLEFRRTKFD